MRDFFIYLFFFFAVFAFVFRFAFFAFLAIVPLTVKRAEGYARLGPPMLAPTCTSSGS